MVVAVVVVVVMLEGCGGYGGGSGGTISNGDSGVGNSPVIAVEVVAIVATLYLLHHNRNGVRSIVVCEIWARPLVLQPVFTGGRGVTDVQQQDRSQATATSNRSGVICNR